MTPLTINPQAAPHDALAAQLQPIFINKITNHRDAKYGSVFQFIYDVNFELIDLQATTPKHQAKAWANVMPEIETNLTNLVKPYDLVVYQVDLPSFHQLNHCFIEKWQSTMRLIGGNLDANELVRLQKDLAPDIKHVADPKYYLKTIGLEFDAFIDNYWQDLFKLIVH